MTRAALQGFTATKGLRLAAFTALWACSPAEKLGLGERQQAFINGKDDRLEYFELTDAAQRSALEQFPIALMSAGNVQALTTGNEASITSWGVMNDLCDGEPFRDEPSASFCSGVLVDWDLVLTSGHCVDVVPLEELRVVLSYYYVAPGILALSTADAYPVEEVLLSRRDPVQSTERLDFAWLRLKDRVHQPHQPASVYTLPPGPALGDPIISIGAGGGIPLKLDAGGHVQDTHAPYADFFVADTDTSEGSSGGGAYAADLGLLGTLARGAPDFVQTSSGCQMSDRSTDPSAALEQFTYVYQSVQALCQVDPQRWVCDPACEQPCKAPSAPNDYSVAVGGCTLTPPFRPRPFRRVFLPFVVTAAGWRRRRRSS